MFAETGKLIPQNDPRWYLIDPSNQTEGLLRIWCYPTTISHWLKVEKGLPWRDVWFLPEGDDYNLKCKKPVAF